MAGGLKLPDMRGPNKIRNFAICKAWVNGDMTTFELSHRYKISQRRIQKIISDNKEKLVVDANFEKLKRIAWLRRKIEQNPDTKKDTADLIEQLRREIEGEKPLIEQHTHYVYQWGSPKDNPNSLQPAGVSEGDSRIPEA